jgi:hypothetical protein
LLEFGSKPLGTHGTSSYAQIIGPECSQNPGKSIALIEVSIKRGYLQNSPKPTNIKVSHDTTTTSNVLEIESRALMHIVEARLHFLVRRAFHAGTHVMREHVDEQIEKRYGWTTV